MAKNPDCTQSIIKERRRILKEDKKYEWKQDKGADILIRFREKRQLIYIETVNLSIVVKEILSEISKPLSSKAASLKWRL